MLGKLKEKLSRLPLRTVLILFGTLLIIGYYRHGSYAAYWVLGWAAYFAARFIMTVKRKVEQASSIKQQNL